MQTDKLRSSMTQKERERREIQRQIDHFIQRGGRIAVIEQAQGRSATYTWQRDHDDALTLFYS
jgi:outer membrane biogenesis lipoprotein LolB|tara:strand:+ start:6488 stop:6676 length:189 start_codon:yes stop_codon:yes gene_type:complete